jgi:hypothetical protein
MTQHRPGLSEGLQSLVGKALVKDRKERYQHIGDLFADFKRQKNMDAESSPAVVKIEPAPAPPKRSRRYSLIGAITALALLAIILVWLFLQNENKPIAVTKTTLSIFTSPESAAVLLDEQSIGAAPFATSR